MCVCVCTVVHALKSIYAPGIRNVGGEKVEVLETSVNNLWNAVSAKEG